MPISRAAFDGGRTAVSWETAIEGYLNSHPSQAFGVLELAKAIEYPVGRISGAYHLHAILHRMAAQGRVDERIVRTGKRTEVFYASMG
jgi:hypothetical protein